MPACLTEGKGLSNSNHTHMEPACRQSLIPLHDEGTHACLPACMPLSARARTEYETYEVLGGAHLQAIALALQGKSPLVTYSFGCLRNFPHRNSSSLFLCIICADPIIPGPYGTSPTHCPWWIRPWWIHRLRDNSHTSFPD